MTIGSDAVLKAADYVEKQHGGIDNVVQQNGLASLNHAAIDAIRAVCPQTSKNVDAVFGAARVVVDLTGNGTIEFGGVANALDSIYASEFDKQARR